MKKAFYVLTQAATGVASMLTLAAGNVMAFSVQDGADAARADGMPTELVGNNGFISRMTSLILMAVGLISVIMLIYGGFRYVVSGGDNKKVTDAKNTILYAIIGLIIALLAYAIVNFVISAVTGVTTTVAE